ncbi:MAG: hypothetical protein ACI3V2_08075 [Faecousia sp.]
MADIACVEALSASADPLNPYRTHPHAVECNTFTEGRDALRQTEAFIEDRKNREKGKRK